jgi:transcriptional regulator with XRE-family HTH domain
MSTENRLREERVRLGLSQEAFSAIAKAAKRAQIYYEKGERKPDAEYLTAISTAGADVLYILTGRREGTVGSGLSVPEAEARLSQIEAAMHAAGDNLPLKDEAQSGVLQSVALDATLPDRTRARADMLLRLGFEDDGAEDRHAAREVRIHSAYRRAHQLVEDAARQLGWQPSLQIQSGLERLIATAPDAPDEVIKWVLSDLISALKADASTPNDK